MTHDGTVFIVDDDDVFRASLQRLIESAALPVEAHASAEAFLARCEVSCSGCLVLDIRMPGMTGLELQQTLAARGIHIPIIIISGHADVESAVQAMKGGAMDFIKKPYDAHVLLERVRQALARSAQWREEQGIQADVAARFALLTPREIEVATLLAQGRVAKQIAYGLGLSRKTVDVHRGHVMMKLRVDSLVDLVKMAQIHGIVGNNAPA